MLRTKNNLKNTLLKYFILFSISILGLLWILQAILFQSFYKDQKINDVYYVSSKLKKIDNSSNFYQDISNLAIDKNVCIEINNNNYDLLYQSNYIGKGCILNKETTYSYKFDFITNNKKEETYYIKNDKYNNETIVYAVRLNNNEFAFINTSIEPVDGIVLLIRKELIVITIMVLILSYIMAYYLSNNLSKPIKNMNDKARILATGNFDIEFLNDSKILEIEELSQSLNYAKDELSVMEEMKRDLLANVSHDLKTPLTLIKGTAEMLEDLHRDNPEKRSSDIQTITEEVDRLTNLVNDILDLSKMNSIQEELILEDFDLVVLIQNILKRYDVLKETEKYKFVFDYPKKTIIINADKKKIEQVIYNLINNAIQYTGDDNTIYIDIIIEKEIIVKIRDTGKGIDKKEIPFIWDKYYKNKKKHKRNLVGTGLGLSIVKKILDQHHFSYGVESIKNQGTTFYFSITK